METTYIAIAIAAAIIVGVILIHNRIRSGRNAVARSWSDVLVYERQKLQTVPQLQPR